MVKTKNRRGPDAVRHVTAIKVKLELLGIAALEWVDRDEGNMLEREGAVWDAKRVPA